MRVAAYPLSTMVGMLAQGPPPGYEYDLLIAIGLLSAALLLGALLVHLVQRRLRRSEDPSTAGGFSLEEVEQLRAQGRLNDQEYELLRARVIGQIRQSLDEPPPPSG